MTNKIVKEREFGKVFYSIMAQIRDAIYENFKKESDSDWTKGVIVDLERYSSSDTINLIDAIETGSFAEEWEWYASNYNVHVQFRKAKGNTAKEILFQWNDDIEANSLIIRDSVTGETLYILNSVIDFDNAPGNFAAIDFDERDVDAIVDYLKEGEIYESRKTNKKRRIYESNTEYNVPSDLQLVWEWIEHNVLDNMKLTWYYHEGVYATETILKVQNVPSKVISMLKSYIKACDDDRKNNYISWKANNATYRTNIDVEGITMSMRRNDGHISFTAELNDKDEFSVTSVDYLPGDIVFKADSL